MKHQARAWLAGPHVEPHDRANCNVDQPLGLSTGRHVLYCATTLIFQSSVSYASDAKAARERQPAASLDKRSQSMDLRALFNKHECMQKKVGVRKCKCRSVLEVETGIRQSRRSLLPLLESTSNFDRYLPCHQRQRLSVLRSYTNMSTTDLVRQMNHLGDTGRTMIDEKWECLVEYG